MNPTDLQTFLRRSGPNQRDGGRRRAQPPASGSGAGAATQREFPRGPSATGLPDQRIRHQRRCRPGRAANQFGCPHLPGDGPDAVHAPAGLASTDPATISAPPPEPRWTPTQRGDRRIRCTPAPSIPGSADAFVASGRSSRAELFSIRSLFRFFLASRPADDKRQGGRHSHRGGHSDGTGRRPEPGAESPDGRPDREHPLCERWRQPGQ